MAMMCAPTPRSPAAHELPRVLRPLPPIKSMQLTAEQTDVGDVLYGPIYSCMCMRDPLSTGGSLPYVSSFGRGQGERNLTEEELLKDGLSEQATVRLIDSFPVIMLALVPLWSSKERGSASAGHQEAL